jgi:hypothetical protein
MVPTWLAIVSSIVTGIVGFLAKPFADSVLGPLFDLLMRPPINRLRDRQMAPRETFQLRISAKYADLEQLAMFRYILVQYGPNGVDHGVGDWIPKDREDEVQVQNRYGPVQIQRDRDSDATILNFRLPIHDPFGTLFKLFALPKKPEELNKLRTTLETASPDEILVEDSSKGAVWFLLNPKNPRFNRFLIRVTTPPNNFENNYVLPRRF